MAFLTVTQGRLELRNGRSPLQAAFRVLLSDPHDRMSETRLGPYKSSLMSCLLLEIDPVLLVSRTSDEFPVQKSP